MDKVISNKKLAVIIPYRDRADHLAEFLRRFPIEVNKGREIPIEYGIFVIEQSNDKLFNRGKLNNVGFALTKDAYDYFCFHDVDMMPIDADYSYPAIPTHLASDVSQFRSRYPEREGLAYPTFFGGVVLFNKYDFIEVNGYSNEYWGWGGEDDDLLFRILIRTQLQWVRRKGVFESLPHPPSKEEASNERNFDRLLKIIKNELADNSGLSDLTFVLKKTQRFKNPTYTIFSVDI